MQLFPCPFCCECIRGFLTQIEQSTAGVTIFIRAVLSIKGRCRGHCFCDKLHAIFFVRIKDLQNSSLPYFSVAGFSFRNNV